MFSPPPYSPSPENLEQNRRDFANALLVMREQLTPLFDAADGMRADLIERGWSPQAAEALVLTWTQGILAACTPTAESEEV